MTHHAIKILEDGTRVYSNGTRYKPKALEDRKYGIRKLEGAIFFRGEWYLPLDLSDPANRVMPETRADSDAYEHREKKFHCRCLVCKRPEAKRWRQKWEREQAALV